jgi:hypothetical protein
VILPLKPICKFTLSLISLNILLLLTAYLLELVLKLNIDTSEIIILSLGFSIIDFITILIFLRGQTREPESQTLHSLVALSLKFLLEMIFALLWFFVAKKKSLPSVLIFFVLYLTLTLFTIWVILKTLKNKAL